MSLIWKIRLLWIIGTLLFILYGFGFHTGFVSGVCMGASATLSINFYKLKQ